MAAVVAILGARPGSSEEGSAPQIVRSASAAYASTMLGALGMQRHFVTVLHAGPVSHTEQSDSGILLHDGAFVEIAYYRIADDGRTFTTSETQRREGEANQDWKAGKVFFKEPYDPRFMGDYRFDEAQACVTCPVGTIAVSFTSAIPDAQHGNGTMWIDRTSARIVQLTYIPNVLPPHASSGSVTEIGGWAGPHLWCVVRIEESYQGHAFLFHGTGVFTGTFDHFRRFATLSDGQAALRDQTI